MTKATKASKVTKVTGVTRVTRVTEVAKATRATEATDLSRIKSKLRAALENRETERHEKESERPPARTRSREEKMRKWPRKK